MGKRPTVNTPATLPHPQRVPSFCHTCAHHGSVNSQILHWRPSAELLTANGPRQTSQLLAIITWDGTLTSESPCGSQRAPSLPHFRNILENLNGQLRKKSEHGAWRTTRGPARPRNTPSVANGRAALTAQTAPSSHFTQCWALGPSELQTHEVSGRK